MADNALHIICVVNIVPLATMSVAILHHHLLHWTDCQKAPLGRHTDLLRCRGYLGCG